MMKKKLSFAGIASVILFMILRIQGSSLKTIISKRAIVDLEFANTTKRIQELFSVWNLQVVKMNIWIDFLFIIAYVSFLSIAAKTTALKWQIYLFKQAGFLFSRLAFFVGLLDGCENILMLQTTAGSYTDTTLQLTFYCATFKFILAGLIVLYLLISLPYNWLKKQ